MANYTISEARKKIYVDIAKITEEEKSFIAMKQNEGFTVQARKPSKKKGSASAPAKDLIFSKIKDDAMMEEAKAILNGTGKGHGFFALKKWAKEKGLI